MTSAPETFGRWTVVAPAAPARQRPSSPKLRPRTKVRCVCGVVRVVWTEDLERSRTTGCESRKCAVRHQVVQELASTLDNAANIPTGTPLVDELKRRLARWLVAARQRDRDEGWQVTAGRSRERIGGESESSERGSTGALRR